METGTRRWRIRQLLHALLTHHGQEIAPTRCSTVQSSSAACSTVLVEGLGVVRTW
ncbi:hypothetical protein SBD_5362 [Streptomyces bottropensis ATCC 25435]|uniref:Uncharacterized protein n=1 Tax=Streptomyces bottropensis ATCC 25435 TaxID=1054862 RepID=M3EXD2_9ACTN|nr:hypothetical protein SBD_5362 [Streptomyces bottropensis ATCC 25435]